MKHHKNKKISKNKNQKDKKTLEKIVEKMNLNVHISSVVLYCMFTDIINTPGVKIDIKDFGMGMFINCNATINTFSYIDSIVNKALIQYDSKHKGTKMSTKDDFRIFLAKQQLEYRRELFDDIDKYNLSYFDLMKRYKTIYGVTQRTIDKRQDLLEQLLDNIISSNFKIPLDKIEFDVDPLDKSIMILYSVYKYFGYQDEAYFHFNNIMMNYLKYIFDNLN